MKNRILAVLLTIALFFFILTFSIGLPIYVRPFYFCHIDPLNLPEISGFTEAEIKDGYSAVLDYLTLPGKRFSTGVIPHSPDGAAHFADCKILFSLNGSVLLLSGVLIAVLLLYKKLGRNVSYRLGKHTPLFYAGIGAVGLPLILGGLAATDFDKAFTVFHSIFFPGKDNWMFDWDLDPIIRILPQAFFRNAAILIGVGVLLLSAACILTDILYRKKRPVK